MSVIGGSQHWNGNGGRVFPKVVVPAEDWFHLSREEIALFALLKDAARRLAFDLKIMHLTPRVAGGWVRDKILSKVTGDIDIAIDAVPGEKMARYFGELAFKKYGQKVSVHVVKLNHDKSKHIESASVTIDKVTIDFTQLRSERYTSDSRTPITEPGDCYTDAMRRDLTINSLFYNLITGKIEDYTGVGLDDIRSRLARTPVDPKKTFDEDPLRMLRLVRFIARFELKYQDDLLEAAKDKTIKYVLCKKVSRERMRAEILKMFGDKNRIKAIKELIKFELYESVFIPENIGNRDQFAPFCSEIAHYLSFLYEIKNHNAVRSQFLYLDPYRILSVLKNVSQIIKYLPTNVDDIALLYVAAAFYPMIVGCNLIGKRNSVEEIVMNQLKMSSKEASWIRALISAPATLDCYVHVPKSARIDAGRIILSLCNRAVEPEKWEQCVVFATAVKAAIARLNSGSDADDHNILVNAARNYNTFLTIVENEKLNRCHEIKPCIRGEVIRELLGLDNPGPVINEVRQNVVYWQIETPGITPDQCERRIVEEFGSGRGSKH